MTEPTDAEIIALADETRTGEPGREGYILPINFARAVLAKWGQPAHSGEPVAWLDPWTGTKVTTDYDAYGKHGIPLYTAPQPVAREKMTNAHIRAMLNKHPPEDVCDWSYRLGIDDAELHHGIKGG
jgi:hypothetical protein